MIAGDAQAPARAEWLLRRGVRDLLVVPGGGLFDLARKLDAPTSLKSIGMSESDLDRAAELATASPYWNPRPVDRDGIRALLDDAFHGRRPPH